MLRMPLHPAFGAARGWFYAAAAWTIVTIAIGFSATSRSVPYVVLVVAIEIATVVLLLIGLRWIGSREVAAAELKAAAQRQLLYPPMERAGPVIVIIDDQMRGLELCLARLDRGPEFLSILLSQKVLLPEYADAVAQARGVSPEAYQDLNNADGWLQSFDRVAAGLHEAWDAEGWPHDQDRYVARISDARGSLVEAKRLLTQARKHLTPV